MTVEALTMSAQAAKPTEGPCRERHVLSVVTENKPLLTAAQRTSSFLGPQTGLGKEGSDQMRLLSQAVDREVELLM
jgi:hypothetical protein